jgi:hypothetical protein
VPAEAARDARLARTVSFALANDVFFQVGLRIWQMFFYEISALPG